MVSILTNIVQHEQQLFSFQADIFAVYSVLSMPCHLLDHRVKRSRVKGQRWRLLIYYYTIICYVLSEATTTVLKSFTNFTGKHLCWSLVFKN